MKKTLILIFIALCVGTVFIFQNREITNDKKGIEVAGEKIVVFIADTPEEQRRGLGGMTKLQNARGMLFLFDKKTERTFWNKDTAFPIGIIWISDMVVRATSTLPSEITSGRVQTISPVPVDVVLELEASDQLFKSVQIGDKIAF